MNKGRSLLDAVATKLARAAPAARLHGAHRARGRHRARVPLGVVEAHRGRWLIIALLSTRGLLAAVLLGLAQGRRLARPLERLAQTSRRLGRPLGQGGSGVGLHLARSLIESVGVQLELRAAHPPEFEVRLRPAEDA